MKHVFLALALLSGHALSQGGAPLYPGQERGELRTIAPQPGEVVLADRVLHLDEAGGCRQSLIELTSGGGRSGFGAVWRDQRDGNLGIYMGVLDADGKPSNGDRPVNQPRTTRQIAPRIAMAADGSGGVTWVFTVGSKHEVHVRFFGPSGEFLGGHFGIETQAQGANAARRGDPTTSRPAIGVWPNRGAIVAWTDAGKIKTQVFGKKRYRPGKEIRIANGQKGHEATGAVRIVCGPGEKGLLVWPAGKENIAMPVAGRDFGKPLRCGAGDIRALRPDPRGGFWALVQTDKAVFARHLSASGRKDARDLELLAGVYKEADFAVGPRSMTLLVQAAPAAGGPPRSVPQVFWFDAGSFADGAPSAVAIDVLPEDSAAFIGARIAGLGERVLVAWTEVSGAHADVHARFVQRGEEGPELGPVQRLNSDMASSDQQHSDLHSNGKQSAAIWVDKRTGLRAAYAARIDASGPVAGTEVRVPRPFEGKDAALETSVHWPCIAVREDGSYIAAWSDGGEHRGILACQGVGADGAALGPVQLVDPGHEVDGKYASDIELFQDGERSLLVWCRKSGGAYARTLDAKGAPLGKVQTLSKAEGDGARNVALARLANGRFIAGWDRRTNKNAPTSVQMRFIDPKGKPVLKVIDAQATDMKGDWDPAFAPGADGAFLMAWCSGEDTNLNRDVVARLYDSRGKSAGPLLPLTWRLNEQDYPEVVTLPDGSFAVAFEGDISGYDHTYIRRVLADGETMGPTVTLNERESPRIPTRGRPLIAALGDNVVSLFSDRRRSQGWDVFLRVLGPGFDTVE